MNYLTHEQYEKISYLVDCAISAANKKEAKRYADQLNFVAIGLQGGANAIFSQLKAATIAATGRIMDKERRVYFCHTELYKLKEYVVDDEANI